MLLELCAMKLAALLRECCQRFPAGLGIMLVTTATTAYISSLRWISNQCRCSPWGDIDGWLLLHFGNDGDGFLLDLVLGALHRKLVVNEATDAHSGLEIVAGCVAVGGSAEDHLLDTL